MLKIKELREARNISQIRMSIELHISQATISKYELGKSEPDISMLCQLADYFGVSVDFLIGYTDKTTGISAEEMEIIRRYRTLDYLHKEKVVSYFDGLLDTV